MTIETETAPAPLRFDDDAGSGRAKYVAGGLVLALVGWMGSGLVLPSEPAPEAAASDPAPRRVAVEVQPSRARAVAQVFAAEGQALPERDTQVLAETRGQIAEVPVRRGDSVAAGDVIARFETTRSAADLTRAEEERTRAARELENARTLLERGSATQDRVTEARADLAGAEAALAAAQEAMDETVVRAPFDGRIEDLEVEAGEFVTAGAAIARVVDATPLRIEIQVPQQQLSQITSGLEAEVVFITGDTAPGEVRFVSRSADPQTRTFTAEIEVANPEGAIPAGVSAQVRIATGERTGHFVSPAILSLDTDGTLGVKTVDDAARVVFQPVQIIRAQTDGVWLAGLPDEARIITVGQGFVNDGELVDPRDPAADTASAEGAAAAQDDAAPRVLVEAAR